MIDELIGFSNLQIYKKKSDYKHRQTKNIMKDPPPSKALGNESSLSVKRLKSNVSVLRPMTND